MADTPSEPAPNSGRRRPRLDLGALGIGGAAKDGPQRKRGKSMFGVLVNTLNKAKAEDKERSASDAAKKRHLIEQRLQTKLRKETDSVRRAEEAKKDKISATRKEEDLQLKDSIHKLRRTRLPQLANFLLTSDVIRENDMDEDNSKTPLDLSEAIPARSHPPPLYYLPAVLTASQEAYIQKRKAHFKEAAEKEWASFVEERAAGVESIAALRKKAAEEEEAKRKEQGAVAEGGAESMAVEKEQDRRSEGGDDKHDRDDDSVMDVDDGRAAGKPSDKKPTGDDDEVEY